MLQSNLNANLIPNSWLDRRNDNSTGGGKPDSPPLNRCKSGNSITGSSNGSDEQSSPLPWERSNVTNFNPPRPDFQGCQSPHSRTYPFPIMTMLKKSQSNSASPVQSPKCDGPQDEPVRQTQTKTHVPSPTFEQLQKHHIKKIEDLVQARKQSLNDRDR